MLRTFDLDDDDLVLIIGSGAGGGTLGNELAQKGVRTLILEAGPRIEREQLLDDERQSFAQLTWLDKRTTSGSWQIAKGLRFLRDSKISAGALPGFDLLSLLLQRGCLSFDALHTSPVACSSSYFFFSLSKPSRKA